MRATFSFIIFSAVIDFVPGDYWSNWSGWSECSRQCDGGVTHQLRKCIKSRHFKQGCDSESIRYATCNNQQCEIGTPDFRAQQCAAYNDAPYHDRYFRWLPYNDPSNPCSLHCLAEGTKMAAMLAPKVLDGTRCNANTLDMCINGKCWAVGCDHVLGSAQTEDNCGMCGGSSDCHHDPQRNSGRYRWVDRGFTSCSVTCGVGFHESVILCEDTFADSVVDQSACANHIKPPEISRECHMKKCLPSWRVGPWRECSLPCGRGVSTRQILCVESFSDGTQMQVHHSFCEERKPSTKKSCNSQMCPTWYAGEWSPCSVSCGGGMQFREVICRHVGTTYCNNVTKPITKKKCSTNIPCFDLADGRYADYNPDANTQEMSIGKLRGASSETEDGINEADADETLTVPKFVVSSWGPCSTSCGSGIRWRSVRCQVYLQFTGDLADLPDSECEDTKPSDTEYCFNDPCYADFKWKSVGMSACSRTCLGGIQETILECTHKQNGSIVSPEYCKESQHLPIERRMCNDFPCPPRWRIGDFDQCSVTCGSGTMTRDVECIQEFAPGQDNILNLPDFMCEKPTPQRQRQCRPQECPAIWKTGPWSQCSVTCGEGYTFRPIFCQRTKPNGRTRNVSLSACAEDSKPLLQQSCNLTDCPKPKIHKTDMLFFQIRKIPKIRLTVGMEAAVLPGITVVVRCPTKGIRFQDIYWQKDEQPLKVSKRVTASKRGNLRIRRARPYKDTGTYTCHAGNLTENFTIFFSTALDLFQAKIARDEFLDLNKSQKIENSQNKSDVFSIDPVDKTLKPLRLVKTDWSACSVSCGGGIRTRNVTCEIITRAYYELFPFRVCLRAGLHRPALMEKCNVEACVHWNVSEWSQCSGSECLGNKLSHQRRMVHCIDETNNIVVNDTACSDTGSKPVSLRDCYTSSCSAIWNTSDWTECSAECGEKGFRVRMISCIWTRTGLPAGRSCITIPRPRTRRPCRSKPCPEYCLDESQHCSIVKLMKLCRYSNFKKNCCHTCMRHRSELQPVI